MVTMKIDTKNIFLYRRFTKNSAFRKRKILALVFSIISGRIQVIVSHSLKSWQKHVELQFNMLLLKEPNNF